MNVLIFDSTSLIYLGKLKILEKLKSLPTKNIIPYSVYKEVVEEGKKFGFVDATYIEKLIENNVFEVKEFKKIENLKNIFSLSEADAEILSAAKQLKATTVIDETAAREIARIEDIQANGTIYILTLLLKNKKINKTEFKSIIDDMINLGWRCSTELYVLILNELEKT